MENDPQLELNLSEDVSFGSDQERAINNAIDVVFGTNKRRLCTLHLKKNILHYMRVHTNFYNSFFQDKEGVAINERNSIIEQIFGNDGILKSKGDYDFETKLSSLKLQISNYKNLFKYFSVSFKVNCT